MNTRIMLKMMPLQRFLKLYFRQFCKIIFENKNVIIPDEFLFFQAYLTHYSLLLLNASTTFGF